MANSRTDGAEILKQVRAARKQETRDRKAGRRAISASYDRRTGRVMLELTSGFVFGFPPRPFPRSRMRRRINSRQ